jgi:hypothetical protein
MISPVTRLGAPALLAGALLPGAPTANAAHLAIKPGALQTPQGWKLAEPAFTLTDEKDKARQRKMAKSWLEKNTVRPDMLEPGPREVSPGLPAVQRR